MSLQAVILADSFQLKFYPATADIPKVLFPLGNEPIIEHLLAWLQQNNINDIYILYQSGKDAIEQYFNTRRRKQKKTFTIKLIYTNDSKSVGDALRELESHKVILQDFLLVNGDVVTNVTLQQPIAMYEELRVKNKMNIMVMVVHTGQHTYEEDSYLYIVDSNKMLLQFDDLKSKSVIKLTTEKIKMDKGIPTNVTIHSDLIESGIYICARDVLKSFQENFLFSELKDDFIREMLTSEIQEEKIHIYKVPQVQTAQRILNPNAYYAVGQKYVSRIFSPTLLPEATYEDFNKYFGQGVKIDSKAFISSKCLIGDKSEICKNVRITNSLIGKGCIISEGSQIINSVLWDNCLVQPNSIVSNSFLGNNVVIGANTVIGSGCLIPNSVQIKSGVQVADSSRFRLGNGDAFSDNAKQFTVEQRKGERMGESVHVQLEESRPFQIDSDSDMPNSHQQKKAQQQDDYFDQELGLLISLCQDKQDQIQSAMINVETLKVNKNKSCTELIDGFMPYFLMNLQADVELIKQKFELWKEFLNRFISGEAECQSYLIQLEVFCRHNPKFYLHQLLQLSYQNQTLNEKQIIQYSTDVSTLQDEFSIQFTQLNDNFIKYLEQQVEANNDEEYEYYYEEDEQQQQQ